MKYIVLEASDGARYPVLFPEALTHCFVAGAMQLVLDTLDKAKDLRPRQLDQMLERGEYPVVSAGFVKILDALVAGRSESLGDISSNPADAGRIVLGEAIKFAPDELVLQLYAKMKEMQGG